MYKLIKLNTALFIIFIVSACLGADHVIGHPAPLKSELLENPIKLECPVTIKEWRGNKPTQSVINDLSFLCKLSWYKFPEFIKSKGYKLNNSGKDYSASFITDSKSYRNLNDLTYRFNTRSKEVYGNTHYKSQYIFITNDYNLDIFYEVWVHELYHAMSDI